MKKIFSTLLLCFALNTLLAQYKCNEDSIMTIIGKWKKIPDANMLPHKNIAQIISRIDKISKIFQAAYPEPKGTKAEWYRDMGVSPLVPDGPAPYDFNSSFQYWYCNLNENKLMPDARVNSARIFINSLDGFLWDQQDMLKVKVSNMDVYMLPNPTGEWKGYPLYDSPGDFGASRSILFLHNNKVPWKPITQEQYLFAVKAQWQKRKDEGAKGYAEQIADLKKSIKEWQDNKDIKPADKKELIASLENGISDYKKAEKKFVDEITSLYAKKIAVIDTYIVDNPTKLTKPAIIDRTSDDVDNFSGNFSEIQKGGHMLVTLNADYFNKALPDYVPQLMVFYWVWWNVEEGLYFKKQIEENFPVQKLQEMIDK